MSLTDSLIGPGKLDSDLLRTFLTIAEAGSFTKGAARVYRSQSAVSLQIKRLEALLGSPVFERHARGVVLSPSGERLRPQALRVIELLDRAQSELSSTRLAGSLRVGIPDEYGETVLPQVIARFAQQHPLVELAVRCGFSADFPAALEQRELDVAVYALEEPAADAPVIKREQALWVTSGQHLAEEQDPLPVALFDRACWWRDRATEALERAGRRYRVAYTSESVAGVKAAIAAGAAVGVLAEGFIGQDLRALSEGDGFPKMPDSALVLACRKGAPTPLTAAMTEAITQAFDCGRSG
jgi:DNA-binding transcriptional LysR family regulator